MMLRALYGLFERREELRGRLPGFTERPIPYLVVIDADGTFINLEPRLDDRGKPRKQLGPEEPRDRRGTKIVPDFLLDKAQYFLGIDKKDAATKRGKECFAAFVERTRTIANQTQDAGALAALKFLERIDEHRDQVLGKLESKAWDADPVLAFSLSSDDGMPVFDREAIRARWVSQLEDSAASKKRCIVTGGMATVERLHPLIKGVPGSDPQGAKIVSFNKDAFLSQGAEQGDNSPVSRRGAEGYKTALNWLLERRADRRFRSGVSLGAQDAVIVFWTRDPHAIEEALLDLLSSARDDSADDAIHHAETPLRGLEPADGDDNTPFYAATLSGAGPRVVVRDWLETTAAEVKKNVKRWFDDLRLEGVAEKRPLSVYDMERALQITPDAQDKRGLPPALSARLFACALKGTPFPRELLNAALRRLRVPPDKKDKYDRQLGIRCALVKAILLRLKPKVEVTVALDETNKRTSYVLGRLFAVLERLQAFAIDKPNASIRDRFFTAASTTPALVFPRLVSLANHHMKKIDHKWPSHLVGPIVDLLEPNGYPRMLPIEDQGIFGIGYWHQHQALLAQEGQRP